MFRFWAGTRTGSGGSFLFLLCLCKVFSATIEPEIHTEKTHGHGHGVPQAGPAPVQPYPGALILRQSEQQRVKNAKRKELQKTRRLQ